MTVQITTCKKNENNCTVILCTVKKTKTIITCTVILCEKTTLKIVYRVKKLSA